MIACSAPLAAVQLAVELEHVFFNHDWGTDDIDVAYREFEREKAVEEGGGATPPTADLPPEIYSTMWRGIRVRIGIHTGLAEIKFDEVTKGYDYYGRVSNIAARTESAGHGGQICITKSTLEALGDAACEFQITALGAVVLRGEPDPVELFQVASVPNRQFPSLKKDGDVQNEDDSSSSAASMTGDSSAGNKYSVDADGNETFSVGSAQGRSKQRWRTLTEGFISIVLSTCEKSKQRLVLDILSGSWRLHVNGSHTKKLVDNPHVYAIARRIAPMIQKKCNIALVAPVDAAPATRLDTDVEEFQTSSTTTATRQPGSSDLGRTNSRRSLAA